MNDAIRTVQAEFIIDTSKQEIGNLPAVNLDDLD
jgi:hypothetical protein